MGTGARTAEVRIIKIDRGHYQVTTLDTTNVFDVKEYPRPRLHRGEIDLGSNDVYGTKDEAEDEAQAVKDGLLDEGYDEVWVREV